MWKRLDFINNLLMGSKILVCFMPTLVRMLGIQFSFRVELGRKVSLISTTRVILVWWNNIEKINYFKQSFVNRRQRTKRKISIEIETCSYLELS